MGDDFECAPAWGGTILNALRCALHIFSGIGFFIRDSEKPAGLSESPFHGRGRGGKRHLQRRFLRKRGAAGLPLPSCRFASSHLPQGDGFRGGGKLCGSAKRRPLGGAGALAPEGVNRRGLNPLRLCFANPPPPKGGGFALLTGSCRKAPPSGELASSAAR